MVEKLLCRFQERCRGALWDSDRFRNFFFAFYNCFGIAVWFAGLAYKPLFCVPR